MTAITSVQSINWKTACSLHLFRAGVAHISENKPGRFAIACVAAMVIASCAIGSVAAAQPSTQMRLKFGVSAGVNTAAQPALYAKSAGVFQRYGVNVEIVNMHDDTTAVQGLIAGAYDLLYAGAAPGLIAISRGAPLRIVSSFTPWSDFLFVGLNEVRTLKDMEGRALGVSKVGSLSYLAAMFALRREGVDLKKVRLVAAGNDPDRARMMATGNLAGGVLNGINAAQALSTSKNLHVVSDVGQAFRGELLGTAVFVRLPAVRDKSKEVQAVVTALMVASRELQTDKEKAIRQATSTGLPAAAVRATYDRLYALPQPYYGVDGGIDEPVVLSTLKLLKEDGDIEKMPPLSSTVDMRFLREAQRLLGPYSKN